MPYAFKTSDGWVEINGAFATDEFSYPPGWAEGSTPEARLAAGVAEITEADVTPQSHQRLVGVELVDVGGLVPMRQGVYEELTLQERQTAMLAAIREQRWAHEQAGFIGPAGPVRTDDKTQSKLTGALVMFGRDTSLSTLDWELSPGVWATVTEADVAGMGVLVGQHAQACFTHSRGLSDAVMASETHADLNAIDITAGWPA